MDFHGSMAATLLSAKVKQLCKLLRSEKFLLAAVRRKGP